MTQKLKKIIIISTLILVFVTVLTSCEELLGKGAYGGTGSKKASQGLDYEKLEDGSYAVSGIGSCKDSHIVIPKTIYGNDVTAITDEAFKQSAFIKSVTIPGTVKSIGKWAFMSSNKLEKVVIEDGVEHIGERAFENCKFLKSITVPASVGEVVNGLCGDCPNLESVTLAEGIKYIGSSAFYGSRALKSIDIPSTVETIGWGAFMHCTGLVDITIPEGVKTLEMHILDGCTSLRSITVPANVESIKYMAFARCTMLEEVIFNASEVADLDYSENVFASSGLEGAGITFKVGAGVKRIPANLFYSHPDSDSSVPKEAAKLVRVEFEEGSACSEIGEYAFNGCKELVSITLPSGVTRIGDSAFKECATLGELYLPSTVTEIDNNAFYGCSSLRELALPSDLSSIGDWAFYECNQISKVKMENSVVSLGERAFMNCKALVDITFEGTRGEWDMIEKSDYWSAGTGYYTIHCTDGDIEK